MIDNRTVMDVIDGRVVKALYGLVTLFGLGLLTTLGFISNGALNKIEVLDSKINAINNQLAAVTDLSRRVGYLEVWQHTFYANGKVP